MKSSTKSSGTPYTRVLHHFAKFRNVLGVSVILLAKLLGLLSFSLYVAMVARKESQNLVAEKMGSTGLPLIL